MSNFKEKTFRGLLSEKVVFRLLQVRRKERETLEFRAIYRGKNTCFPWKWKVGKKILVDIRMLVVT